MAEPTVNRGKDLLAMDTQTTNHLTDSNTRSSIYRYIYDRSIYVVFVKSK